MWINNKIITILALIVFLAATLGPMVPAGHCITIQEEREMSKEFMEVVRSQFPLIRDPIIVDYVNRVGNRIVSALPSQPFTYHFYVLHVDVYNAFASPAGHIFINSGLLAALKSEEELAGILGHEIAHVNCRHLSQRYENSKKINMATLAGMVAGVLLGAGGAGAAASAVTMGSVAAGQSAMLAYSREDEMQADQIGLEYLTNAGYSGEGLLTSLNIIRSKEWYGSKEIPTYLTTHPGSEDRIIYIDSWLHQNPSRLRPQRQETGGFELAHTRLQALYTEQREALNHFKGKIETSPKDPMANYGYALALTREDRWHDAAEHMKIAIEGNAMTAHMLQDLGEIYFHDGEYEKALSALSAGASAKDPEGKLYLGRTQMELDRTADAKETFEDLIRDNENFTLAYYYLGEASGRMGDMFGAHYNLGIFYGQKRDLKNAQFHLNRAKNLAANEAQKKMVERRIKMLDADKKGKHH